MLTIFKALLFQEVTAIA